MSNLDDMSKRIPLEEIDEKIAAVRRSLDRVNGSTGPIVVEHKLEAVLDILAAMNQQIRVLRDAAALPITED